MGVIFIVVLIAGGIFLGYAYHISQALNKESKEYTDIVVPKVLSGWDAAMFDQYADHNAMKDANLTPQQMAQIFAWSKNTLGNMTEYLGSAGEAYVRRAGNMRMTGAQYMAYAKFQHGEAKILVTLTKNANGDWKIAGFNVNSPSFTNIPTPYR